MKKYILILILALGMSDLSFAQERVSRKHGGKSVTQKKQDRQQRSHFEKRHKDKKLNSNGSSYKTIKKYKVDGDGFASIGGLKKNKKFVKDSRSMRKQYKNQLRESVYAKNTAGGSLRRQLLRGR